MVTKIQALKDKKILWNDDGVSVWDIAVDGVHTRCNEPKHPVWSQDKKYFSHKCKHAGYGYELATRLHTNQLCWMNGPFPAGLNDISVFKKKGLREELRRRNKKAIGDKGYNGSPDEVSTFNAHDKKSVKMFKRRALMRHETFNGRIKEFAILNGTFRHSEAKFKSAFEAVCVLCQYKIEIENPLFDILTVELKNRFDRGN